MPDDFINFLFFQYGEDKVFIKKLAFAKRLWFSEIIG